VEELISRIKLHDGDTEFWRSRFMGESTTGDTKKAIETEDEDDNIKAVEDEDDDTEEEDEGKEGEEDDLDTEEEEPEAEVENVEDDADDIQQVSKEEDDIEGGRPPELIGSQLLKDWEETFFRKKSSKKLAPVYYPVCIISILVFIFWSKFLALTICLIYTKYKVRNKVPPPIVSFGQFSGLNVVVVKLLF
jgi:hypothetical protein